VAAKIEIAGVDHTFDLSEAPIRVELIPNGRSRLTFTTRPGYVPARMANVVAYKKDGVTPLWTGILLQRRVSGAVAGDVQSVAICECVDKAAYLDWCIISLSYTAPTSLQIVLEAIVAALPPESGITLDATDYTGIMLDIAWVNMRASDCLRELRDRLGLSSTVSPLGVLSLGPTIVSSGTFDTSVFDSATFGSSVSGGSAPASITATTPHFQELAWEDPTVPPVTTVKVRCGSGTIYRTQTWLSTGTDGPWVADVAAAGPGNYWTVGLSPGNPYCTVDDGTGGGMFWWDWSTHTLRSRIGVIADGVTISFRYLAQLPFTVTATTGATPDVVALKDRPEVFDLAQGQAIANGLLAQLGTQSRRISVQSDQDEWLPGQTLSVDLPDREIVGTFAIIEVAIELVHWTVWRYTITAVELSAYPGTYLDQWRALLKAA